MKKNRSKGMLGRRHGLAGNNPAQSNLLYGAMIGGGIILGMISYPQRDTPLGSVLLIAGATGAAIGAVLLLHHALLPTR